LLRYHDARQAQGPTKCEACGSDNVDRTTHVSSSSLPAVCCASSPCASTDYFRNSGNPPPKASCLAFVWLAPQGAYYARRVMEAIPVRHDVGRGAAHRRKTPPSPAGFFALYYEIRGRTIRGRTMPGVARGKACP